MLYTFTVEQYSTKQILPRSALPVPKHSITHYFWHVQTNKAATNFVYLPAVEFTIKRMLCKRSRTLSSALSVLLGARGH